LFTKVLRLFVFSPKLRIGNEICYRGEIEFTPFARAGRKDIAKAVKYKTYRLVATKTERKEKINKLTFLQKMIFYTQLFLQTRRVNL